MYYHCVYTSTGGLLVLIVSSPQWHGLLDISVFVTCTYRTHHQHFHILVFVPYYHCVYTSAGRLLVSEGFIRPIVTKLTIYVFISWLIFLNHLFIYIIVFNWHTLSCHYNSHISLLYILLRVYMYLQNTSPTFSYFGFCSVTVVCKSLK